MSSTNKTTYLGLNSWLGTDKPQRADFNTDNELIDTAIGEHFEDEIRHITGEERETWNSPYFIGTYFGNGETPRTITTKCPFEPSIVIVFANSFTPTVTNFSASTVRHYFGFATKRGSTMDFSFDKKNLIIKSTTDGTNGNEYVMLNQIGKTYIYIMIR